MKTRLCPAALAIIAFAASNSMLSAQVPQLINYQGRVAADGVNFSGSGQFKFALVDGTGGVSRWSNDGTSVAGSEPGAAVSLPVNKGLYSVLLGDTALPNMAAVPATVFNNNDVRVRVWFNDGTHGFQHLTPDQRIAAVGYSLMAADVPDGAITAAKIASGAVGSAHIANGAVGSSKLAANAVQSANIGNGAIGVTQLAPGAVQSANIAPGAVAATLQASNQSVVASGGLILATQETAALANAGYVRIGVTTLADAWVPLRSGPPPAAREAASAVWTGSEMIVWGGVQSGNYLNSGARYDPARETWTAISISGAPPGRVSHTAIWTGAEMIVWGGTNGTLDYNDGGRYDPAADSWSAVTTTSAPAARTGHTAVWTGTEMIVWGGAMAVSPFYLKTGGRYRPAGDNWASTDPGGSAPAPRRFHTAIRVGTDMIIWGGENGVPLDTGKVYHPGPGSGSWTDLSASNRPAARYHHTAIWTGSEMIVWGGTGAAGPLNDGARILLATGTPWTSVTPAGAPLPRSNHTAVWTGSEMIVWGGSAGGALNDGALYQPSANIWTPMIAAGAPPARDLHTAFWTGSSMLIWGGRNSTGWLDDAFSYFTSRPMILFQRP